MQESKVQAWDVKTKRLFEPRTLEFVPGTGWWVSGENVYDREDGTVKEVASFGPARVLDTDVIVRQSIPGVYDKNRNPIYPQDVVEISGIAFNADSDFDPEAEIYWDDRDLTYKLRSCHPEYDEVFHNAPLAEFRDRITYVLGNTLKNPEMARHEQG